MPNVYFTNVAVAAGSTPIQTLISGLTADGVFAKLDRLWVFAQATEALALVDLVAGATATAVNSPTFTANSGYTGQDLATVTSYINSGYNPSMGGINYTQNAAHCSFWSVTDIAAVNGGCQLGSDKGSVHSNMLMTYLDGNVYARVNDNPQSGSQGAPGTRQGFWLINRSGASATQLYQNSSLFSSPNGTSDLPPNANFYILADNNNDFSADLGTPNQLAMVSMGGNLSSTDVTNFYNRLRTYMTAVGVP